MTVVWQPGETGTFRKRTMENNESVAQHLADSMQRIMDEIDKKYVTGTHQHTQAIFLRGLGATVAAIAELEIRMKEGKNGTEEKEDSPLIIC